MSVVLGVFGSAGFGREAMPLARAHADEIGADRAVFVEPEASRPVNGHDVMSEDAFFGFSGELAFTIAISDPKIRARLFAAAERHRARPVTLRAGSAEIMDAVDIGPGAILCSHSYIGSNVRIGRGLHLNYFSQIAHDCVVGDFVTLAPRATCNGGVIIEDGAYLGSGCVVRQSRSKEEPLVIGAGAIVGMGAIVTKSVPAGATVIGNPARILEKA